MPQADTKALIAEIADGRRLVDMLVNSITTENEQLREQCRGASEWISRHSTLSALLIEAMLASRQRGELTEKQKAALAEYEALHGSAVSESAKLRKLVGG